MLQKNFSFISDRLMYATYNKVYYKPHDDLKKYISHYAISFVPNRMLDEKTGDLTIIPDGSGCMYYEYKNNHIIDACWGPTTKIETVKRCKIGSDELIFFIEFLPGGLHALTKLNTKELRNKQIKISDIDIKLKDNLLTSILSSRNINELLSKIDMLLIHKLNEKENDLSTVYSALNKIKKTNGTIGVKELAQSEFISERSLGRLFDQQIGLNVKTFERILRINKMVKSMKKYQKNFTYISQEFGYFDQSHFIHDFKDICLTTPSLFTQNMSDFYNETFKF